MTIVLDVSFSDQQSSCDSAINEISRKKVKDKSNSSKAIKVAKVKHKNEKKSKRLSNASSTTATTTSQLSIKDSLMDNKEKLNDLNDQILNSQNLNHPRYQNRHLHAVQRHQSISTDRRHSEFEGNFNSSQNKSESVLSSDSDIRFTRKKLGDNQKCGCILIAGFLVMLLVAGLTLYAGYLFLHQKPAPNRIFRGRFAIAEGDHFAMNLADQNSIEFFEKARDYRERINLLIARSDFRKFYDGCEILALDGRLFDERNNLNTNLLDNRLDSTIGKDLIVHFLLNFDSKSEAGVDELRRLFLTEFQSTSKARFFKNLKLDLNDFQLKEINFGKFDDIFATSSAHVDGNPQINLESEENNLFPHRTCEPITLKFCRQEVLGYNMTTFPNLLGHTSLEEIEKDLITFREVVDSECFLQSYDFLCHLLQPPCELSLDVKNNEIRVKPRYICRSYCEDFSENCLSRMPEKFRPYFDCERFPEQSAMQSCRHRPSCINDLKALGQGLRMCDGIADCPNLEDELTCSYCPVNALYCGRGRACVSREMRCDGKFDCPDGSDEKDCLSISPLVEHLIHPKPLIPHRPQFFHEGFAVFSEKGQTGKLCAEGMESNEFVRSTVAESLCKALGYERVTMAEIRKDMEENQKDYVRVLDPRAAEISFVRTNCAKREAFYLGCSHLECGRQSVMGTDKPGATLPKLSQNGDWPWHVALFKKGTHVCDGTLVASHWVLTTQGCFQGQTKATWTAVFGSIRIGITTPWTQKRRIIGMVKSPVEGSTVALVRLQSAVVYSDFVKSICLPDDDFSRNSIVTDYPIKSALSSMNLLENPQAEKFSSGKVRKTIFTEERQYFRLSESECVEDCEMEDETNQVQHEVFAAEFVDEHMNVLKPEAQHQTRSISYYNEPASQNDAVKKQWTQCNTLGWSRQKEHLQRVQLQVIDMNQCENISIATVNSVCSEATYHKQDCTEEEFAGSPMLCLLSDEKRWALVGVSSWRIACAHSGTERPRMYDKIESNVSWIRSIINAIIT